MALSPLTACLEVLPPAGSLFAYDVLTTAGRKEFTTHYLKNFT